MDGICIMKLYSYELIFATLINAEWTIFYAIRRVEFMQSTECNVMQWDVINKATMKQLSPQPRVLSNAAYRKQRNMIVKRLKYTS